MKIDMLWFATLIAVNLQTAFLSPPVAMSAYYLKGVAPQWELGDIYHGMAQFMVLQLIGLGALHRVPGDLAVAAAVRVREVRRPIQTAKEGAMKPRAIVLTWLAFALPVLILAAVLWHGPGSAVRAAALRLEGAERLAGDEPAAPLGAWSSAR